MSKAFKSSDQANDNRTMLVSTLYGEPRLLIVDKDQKGFLSSKADAPALALAILEAAGFTEESPNFGTAVHELGLAIKVQERITAEAELEAEALELCNAERVEYNLHTVTSLDNLIGVAKKGWLAVARKAREMRVEK